MMPSTVRYDEARTIEPAMALGEYGLVKDSGPCWFVIGQFLPEENTFDTIERERGDLFCLW